MVVMIACEKRMVSSTCAFAMRMCFRTRLEGMDGVSPHVPLYTWLARSS